MSKVFDIKIENTVVTRLEAPERNPKSYETFRVGNLSYKDKEDPRCPCLNCNNTGRIHDPNDSPDPIEGYKMVGHVDCPHCNGTRFIEPKLFKAYFQMARERNEQEQQEFLEYKKTLEELCAKITLKEYNFLKDYFGSIFKRYRVRNK